MKNAWLLTWEGTTGPACIPDKKIIAILSSRLSTSSVESLVDVLYCRNVGSAFDMAGLANKRKASEKQYKHRNSGGKLFYGYSGLCIYARQVLNLNVKRNELNRTELIGWTELAIYGNAEIGCDLVEIEPQHEKECLRSLDPLGSDIWN